MTLCCLFKMFKIFREIPRNLSFISNHTILRHSSYGNKLCFHDYRFQLTILIHPLYHSCFILLNLFFQLFKSREFLIFTDEKEGGYRDNFSINISSKIKNIRFKKLLGTQVHSDTKIQFAIDENLKSVGSIRKNNTISRKLYICCRKTNSTAKMLSMNNFS